LTTRQIVSIARPWSHADAIRIEVVPALLDALLIASDPWWPSVLETIYDFHKVPIPLVTSEASTSAQSNAELSSSSATATDTHSGPGSSPGTGDDHRNSELADLLALRAEVARLSKENAALKKDKREIQVEKCKWKSRSHTAQSRIVALKKRLVDLRTKPLKDRLKRGKKGRYLSLRGGYGIALKRVMCKTAAHAMGITLETDIGPTTVRRWEVKLRAAQLLHFRRWQRQKYDEITQKNPYLRGLKFIHHRVRSDGTNVTWQCSKLQATEIESSFLPTPIPENAKLEHWGKFYEDLETKRILAELQQIRGTGTRIIYI